MRPIIVLNFIVNCLKSLVIFLLCCWTLNTFAVFKNSLIVVTFVAGFIFYSSASCNYVIIMFIFEDFIEFFRLFMPLRFRFIRRWRFWFIVAMLRMRNNNLKKFFFKLNSDTIIISEFRVIFTFTLTWQVIRAYCVKALHKFSASIKFALQHKHSRTMKYLQYSQKWALFKSATNNRWLRLTYTISFWLQYST